MQPRDRARQLSRGLTLVELMVALAIGLVLSLAVALAMLSMGRQFRTVGANASAQINAQLALALIDGAGRTAGAGLFTNSQPLCQRFNAWRNGSVVSNGAPLMPARIIDGGSATASDRLIFSASTATGALSGMAVLDAMASVDANIVISDAGRLTANEMAIVAVPGSTSVPCTLFQVSAAPGVVSTCGGNATQCKSVPHASNSTFNPAAGTFADEPRYGFTSAGAVNGPAVVVGMGTAFRQSAFAVMCDTLVQYDAFTDTPACSVGPLAFSGGANALISDIVQLHAQYGISSIPSSDIVTSWVSASGTTWSNPSADNVGRIKAVRVVIVSRAKEPAGEAVTAASCTNSGGVVNTGPCSFDDAEAPVIDLGSVSIPSGGNWRHYRYRVHQAVMPLRNVIWSN